MKPFFQLRAHAFDIAPSSEQRGLKSLLQRFALS